MEKLLNIENDWDGEVDCPEVMGPRCLISEEEVTAAILRIHVTSPILGERISAIILTQQRKQWLSVELNRWRSERIHCYFF